MGRLRTENLELGAYALAQGAQLDQVNVLDTTEGVTVVFEIDCLGLGDVRVLRDTFYRGLGAGINVANYHQQLGLLSEQMFTAIYHRDARQSRERDSDAERLSRERNNVADVDDDDQAGVLLAAAV